MVGHIVSRASRCARAHALVALTLFATLSLPGCVDFDDLRVSGDAGTADACAAQCRADAVECFCADFDGPGGIEDGWSFMSAGGGSVSAFVEDVQSAPNAALLTCPGSTTGEIGSAFVVLKRGVQTNARRIRVAGSWKLRPYSRSVVGNFEFFSVALGSSTRVALGEAFAGGSDDAPAFRIGVTYVDSLGSVQTITHPVAAPPTDTTRWVRFELDVTFADDGTGSVHLTWNGSEALALTNVTTSSADAGGPATLSAAIGGGTLQGLTPDLWMLFDDVVVEVY